MFVHSPRAMQWFKPSDAFGHHCIPGHAARDIGIWLVSNASILRTVTTITFLLCVLNRLCTCQMMGDCLQNAEAADKLLDAIARSLGSNIFAIVVAAACLQDGFSSSSRGFELVPVSCCTIGAVVKKKCPQVPGKLLANLQQQQCQGFFRIIPGPAGTQPAVLPILAAMIDKPYCKAVAKILNRVHSSSEHPSSGKQLVDFETASEDSSDPYVYKMSPPHLRYDLQEI